MEREKKNQQNKHRIQQVDTLFNVKWPIQQWTTI